MITAITYDVLALLFLALTVAAFLLCFYKRPAQQDLDSKSLGFIFLGLLSGVFTVIMLTHHQVAHPGLESQFFAFSVMVFVGFAVALWLLRRSNNRLPTNPTAG